MKIEDSNILFGNDRVYELKEKEYNGSLKKEIISSITIGTTGYRIK